MSTVHAVNYDNSEFFELELGMSCVNLCLSSGTNRFDLGSLDDPNNSVCYNLPPDVKRKLHKVLDAIVISIPEMTLSIPEIGIPFDTIRLNNLCKYSVSMAWKSAYGGSILLSVSFESGGTEIVGNILRGQMNNAKLSFYLAVSIADDVRIHTTAYADFNAQINIENVSDRLEPRGAILRAISEAATQALAPYARDLAEGLLTTLIQMNPQGNPAPADGQTPFFTQVTISDNHAGISWLNPPVSIKFADVVIDSVDPGFAEDDERLYLTLKGGWLDAPGIEVSQRAMEGTVLALPLTRYHLILPGGLALDIHIDMDRIPLEGGQPKGKKAVGRIHRTFYGPAFGNGSHVDKDSDLTARYHIRVT